MDELDERPAGGQRGPHRLGVHAEQPATPGHLRDVVAEVGFELIAVGEPVRDQLAVRLQPLWAGAGETLVRDLPVEKPEAAQLVGVDGVLRLPAGQRRLGEDVHAETLPTQDEVERPPRAGGVGDQLRRDERQARLEILVRPLHREGAEALGDQREQLGDLPVIDIRQALEQGACLGPPPGRGAEGGEVEDGPGVGRVVLADAAQHARRLWRSSGSARSRRPRARWMLARLFSARARPIAVESS